MWFTVELNKIADGSNLLPPPSERFKTKLERLRCGECGSVVVKEYGLRWAVNGYLLKIVLVEATI